MLHLVVLLTMAQGVYGFQKDQAGLIYSVNGSFFLEAPTGWIIDAKKLRARGIPALFYPKGSTYDNAPEIIYARFVDKDKVTPTFKVIVDDDVKATKAQSATLTATKLDNIETRDHRQAVAYRYDSPDDPVQNLELVAYVDMPKSAALIVFSAKAGADAQRGEKLFDAVVQSFSFSKIKVKAK